MAEQLPPGTFGCTRATAEEVDRDGCHQNYIVSQVRMAKCERDRGDEAVCHAGKHGG